MSSNADNITSRDKDDRNRGQDNRQVLGSPNRPQETQDSQIAALLKVVTEALGAENTGRNVVIFNSITINNFTGMAPHQQAGNENLEDVPAPQQANSHQPSAPALATRPPRTPQVPAPLPTPPLPTPPVPILPVSTPQLPTPGHPAPGHPTPGRPVGPADARHGNQLPALVRKIIQPAAIV